MKKLVSLIVTLVMVLSMAVPAMADDGLSITIKNATEGHTYEAYQVFKGDLTKDASGWKIANAQWGSGVTDAGKAAFGAADVVAESLTDETVAKTFAVQLEAYLSGTKADSEYSSGKYVISGLDEGYYLIKDKDNSLQDDADAYTTYILKVADDTELEPKSSVPTSNKKVDDAADSLSAENGVLWQDSADYDIGDAVPFQLTGTLPENFGEYTSYEMIFHDEQSAGLTFNKDSVKVFVTHLQGMDQVAEGYEVKTVGTHDSNCTFEIVIDDVRQLSDKDGKHIAVTKNSTIVVEYTSTLNENAVIGVEGNPNTMYMEFSNNPNHDGEGDTGKTPEDTVIVFTYKAVINKVDGEMKALKGAGFSLEKYFESTGWTLIKSIPAGDTTVFEFRGLDDGRYRVKETETPDGYNSINDFYFEIIAQHDTLSDAPKLTLLHSNQIDENGVNVTENIIFAAEVDLTSGTIASKIVNKSGATLPETGGMGTTLFYIVGAVLVLGAGVALIARKRMNK
ncbi:MAG: isopeptide-forming domain-containing fimbrial protein [Firmicutes bacterium]|nr:isopeptide-forming domain-containing fimbrial protein [Bacillota bacterium]